MWRKSASSGLTFPCLLSSEADMAATDFLSLSGCWVFLAGLLPLEMMPCSSFSLGLSSSSSVLIPDILENQTNFEQQINVLQRVINFFRHEIISLSLSLICAAYLSNDSFLEPPRPFRSWPRLMFDWPPVLWDRKWTCIRRIMERRPTISSTPFT